MRFNKWSSDEHIVPVQQNAYKPHHRTVNHLLTLRLAIERAQANHKTLYAAYVDLRKAFDLVSRPGLWCRLADKGAAGRIFNITRLLYAKLQFRVHSNQSFSELFPTNTGVLQGDSLSPLLFSLYLSELKLQDHVDDLHLHGHPVRELIQADDLLILSYTKEGLQHHLQSVETFCSSVLAVPNPDKTCIQQFGSKHCNNSPLDGTPSGIIFHGENLLYSTKTKYLGVYIDMERPLAWKSQLALLACNSLKSRGLLSALRPALGRLPPLQGIQYYKQYATPLEDYASEIMFDSPSYLREPVDRSQLLHLRHLLHLPTNSLHAPLWVLTGLLPLHLRWLLNTFKYIVSLDLLPPLHPTRLAIEDSKALSDSKQKGFWNSFSLHMTKIQASIQTTDLGFHPDWLKQVPEAIERARLTFATAAYSAKRSPFLPTNTQAAPAAILHIADRHDRRAMIRFSSGHHYLLVQDWRRKIEARRNGNRPAIRCRACRGNQETELHVLFKCSYWKAVQLRNAFLPKIQDLHVSDATIAEALKQVSSQTESQLRVLARWIRHLLDLYYSL